MDYFCVWHDSGALDYTHGTWQISIWLHRLATCALTRRSVDDVTMTSRRRHEHKPRRAPDSLHMVYPTVLQASCTWAFMTPPPHGAPHAHNGQNVHLAPRTRLPAPSQSERMEHRWPYVCIAIGLVAVSTPCGQSDLLQQIPADLTSFPSLRTT